MKLTRSLLRPLRSGATSTFFRRRLRSNGSLRGGRASSSSAFFTSIGRKRGGGAAENPEPSSPKVTCIGQVRVKSQKKVKQCRRRINGEASFRSAEPSFQHQQRRSRRDQRWVHLPSLSVVLHALGHEFCCLFRCCRCRCSCFERGEREREREREKIRRSGSGCFADENGRGEMFGRWLVAVNGEEGSGTREIEVVVGGGEEEKEAAAEIMSGGNSRRHVFDDIEVIGDRIEVKGRSFINGGVSISIPPKNALLLMRCRSDPIKMAAIANRISSDAGRYENGGGIEEEEDDEEEEEEEEEYDNGSELKIFVTRVLKQEKEEMNNNNNNNVGENGCNEEKPPPPPLIYNEEKAEEIEQEFNDEEKEEVESNMSSFEALLEQENTENYQDIPIDEEDVTKSEESMKSVEDQTSTKKDDNRNPTIVEENDDKQEIKAAPLPENQQTVAAAALPECLLLMMREPKLSMEVSKETWVCATDFIRLLPERPRRASTKAAAGDHELAVKRRVAVERSKPRAPPLPGKKNDMQPARSSCSLPAAAAGERKRVGGDACEPLALTRCKSEPMSTAAAKLMPEAGCWKENVGMQLEPHRQASLEVGAAGVGF